MSSPGSLPADTRAVEDELMYLFGVWEGTTAILLATSTVAVALRCWLRAGVTKTFGYDDAAMLAAQLCYVLCTVLSFVASQSFIQIVRYNNLVRSPESLLSIIRMSNSFYGLTMLLVKLSVAIFFVKLFGSGNRWQRWLVISLATLSAVIGIAWLVFTYASCGIMIQSQKTTPYQTGTDWCPVQQIYVNFSIAWSFVNTITDIVYAALAIAVVWRTQMKLSTKISAATLILIGSVGCAASIGRIVTQFPVTDVRLSGVLLTIYSNAEAGITITATSLIVLRPLVQAFVEKTRSSLSSIRSSVSGGSNGERKGSLGSFSLSRGRPVFGSRRSKLGSTSSSQKDITEIIDMEDQSRHNSGAVVVTRTWHVEEKDDEEASPRLNRHPARVSNHP